MSIFGSIRARFTGWYLVVLAILLIAMSIGIYAVMYHTLIASLDKLLDQRMKEAMFQPDLVRMITDDRHEAPLGEVNGLYVLSNTGWEAIGHRLNAVSYTHLRAHET